MSPPYPRRAHVLEETPSPRRIHASPHPRPPPLHPTFEAARRLRATFAHPHGASSAWSPLHHSVFRALWLAGLVSNIGTWMQNVAGVWLMSSLTPSPMMVALMQTATSLPVLLVGFPGGALADIIDRRRLLLLSQAWMLLAAGGLALITYTGAATPWTLLGLTFALGLGAALNGPAWQATTPDLVPRHELVSAIALGGVSMNAARAVGPALGGLIVAAAGPGAVFLLNMLSFLAVLAVLARWREEPKESLLPAERVLGAMRAGVRYLHHAPALQAVLVRTGGFILGASALWALLPLVARDLLGLGPTGYGVLLGSMGLGAVGGATVLPHLRRRMSLDALVAGASVAFAVVTFALGELRVLGAALAVLLLGGMSWIVMMATLNSTTQTAVPEWVRARSVALYILVFQGVTAAGSALWGAVAERTSVQVALSAAALVLVASTATGLRWPLRRSATGAELEPSLHWPEPQLARPPSPEAGPVLVQVDYRVEPTRAAAFRDAMDALRRVRRRNGASAWGLFEDPADPGRFVESFLVESWGEHQRQHARVTHADRAVEERARAFHVGEGPPGVQHLIAQ